MNRSYGFIFVLFFKLLKALILGRWYWARIKYCQIDRLDDNFVYCFAHCSILGFNYDWILIYVSQKYLETSSMEYDFTATTRCFFIYKNNTPFHSAISINFERL